MGWLKCWDVAVCALMERAGRGRRVRPVERGWSWLGGSVGSDRVRRGGAWAWAGTGDGSLVDTPGMD
jgi:hypothetical protein